MPETIDYNVCENWSEVFKVINDQKTASNNRSKPFIIKTLNLGTCLKNWQSLDYLKSKVPTDREVPLHVAKTTGRSLRSRFRQNSRANKTTDVFRYNILDAGRFVYFNF